MQPYLALYGCQRSEFHRRLCYKDYWLEDLPRKPNSQFPKLIKCVTMIQMWNVENVVPRYWCYLRGSRNFQTWGLLGRQTCNSSDKTGGLEYDYVFITELSLSWHVDMWENHITMCLLQPKSLHRPAFPPVTDLLPSLNTAIIILS